MVGEFDETLCAGPAPEDGAASDEDNLQSEKSIPRVWYIVNIVQGRRRITPKKVPHKCSSWRVLVMCAGQRSNPSGVGRTHELAPDPHSTCRHDQAGAREHAHHGLFNGYAEGFGSAFFESTSVAQAGSELRVSKSDLFTKG